MIFTLCNYTFKAWLIGITIAFSMGPIGIIFVNKAIELGLIEALAVGIGTALADSFFAFIASVSVTAISKIFLENHSALSLVGGIFLINFGIANLKKKTSTEKRRPIKHTEFIKTVIQIFFLTLVNPTTIIVCAALFSTIPANHLDNKLTLCMTMGVFAGSMTWWIILGTMLSYIRKKTSKDIINYITYISSSIFVFIGSSMIIKCFINYLN